MWSGTCIQELRKFVVAVRQGARCCGFRNARGGFDVCHEQVVDAGEAKLGSSFVKMICCSIHIRGCLVGLGDYESGIAALACF